MIKMNSVLGKEELCEINVNQKNCSPPPSDSDLCMKLMDVALFGRVRTFLQEVLPTVWCSISLSTLRNEGYSS